MRDIFQSARRLSPAVLVLDDLEFLGGAVRGSSGGESAVEERLLTTLLNEIDGIDTSAECEVFVLGACSCDLTQLDPALLRPGRLGVHVKVDRPSTQDRKQIFELYVRLYFNHALPLDGTLMDQMVERTAGWSGAEIEFAIRRACATGDAVTSETLLDAL